MNMRQPLFAFVTLLLVVALGGCGFAATGIDIYDPPGFFLGLWHGALAPWTLVLRLFLDIKMYAFPNAGWFYDFGFLIGLLASPLGWLASLVAIAAHLGIPFSIR